MIQYLCDICGKRIEPSREVHFKVRLEIEAQGPGVDLGEDDPAAADSDWEGPAPGALAEDDDLLLPDEDAEEEGEDGGEGEGYLGCCDDDEGEGEEGEADDAGGDRLGGPDEPLARDLGLSSDAGGDILDRSPCERLRFDLCPPCYERYLKDPLKRRSRRRFGFSEN